LKYWRGYLTAAIFGFFSWALIEFAKSHDKVIDMVYPYVTRMTQTFLAQWSAGTDFLLWQLLLVVFAVVVLATVVLMIVFKWNPVQWFGWVLAAAAIVFTLHTGIYGLNNYAGPISDDIRLTESEYNLEQLEAAALYYRDKANALAAQVSRGDDGSVQFPGFDQMALMAGDGFDKLVYDQYLSVFAGSKVPVKKLGWADAFTSAGITSLHMPLTGEAAVNPQIPTVSLPFTICEAMANRMCISIDRDALFAAFLACEANGSTDFRYSAYFMAYYYCMDAIRTMNTIPSNAAMVRVQEGEIDLLRRDLDAYEEFFRLNRKDDKKALADKASNILGEKDAYVAENFTDLLVSWHIQEVVIPSQVVEEIPFDPMDETQVDLTVIPTPTETEGTEE
jgi:hypothetical protein